VSQAAQIEVRHDSRASVTVEAEVLPRAQWATEKLPQGFAWTPQKGTWYGHVVRGQRPDQVAILPMVACPGCNATLLLTHNTMAAKIVRKLQGETLPIPVAHRIDAVGKVSPDLRCFKCSFHRKVYLDRWLKTKPLYAIAHVEGRHGLIQIDYANGIDAREARFHFGHRPKSRIIKIGLAVGFYVDETTGRMTTE
jgi:hypothetical protein